MKYLLTCGLASLLLIVSPAGKAALTIEITGGVEGALPIAVVPFDTSKLGSKMPVDLAEIVHFDYITAAV